MREPSKTKSAKAFIGLIYTVIFVSIVAAGIFAFATKTDDFLRDMLIKHSDFIDPGSALFRNVTYSSLIGRYLVWRGQCQKPNWWICWMETIQNRGL